MHVYASRLRHAVAHTSLVVIYGGWQPASKGTKGGSVTKPVYDEEVWTLRRILLYTLSVLLEN